MSHCVGKAGSQNLVDGWRSWGSRHEAALMSCFFSSDCRTEWSEPSGIAAASAKAAAFASTRLLSFIFVRSASKTALWRGLNLTWLRWAQHVLWGLLLKQLPARQSGRSPSLRTIESARRRRRSRPLRKLEVFWDRFSRRQSAIIKGNCRKCSTAATHSRFLFRRRVWPVDSAPHGVF